MEENNKINVVISKISQLGKQGLSYEAFLNDYNKKCIKTVKSVSGKEVKLVRTSTEVYFIIDGTKISYDGVSEWITGWVAKGENLERNISNITSSIGAIAIFTPEKSTIEIKKQGKLLCGIHLITKIYFGLKIGESSQIYPFLDRIEKLIQPF